MEITPPAAQGGIMANEAGIAARANALARDGRIADALNLLGSSAVRGDPDALFELAVWRFSGEFIPRDLRLARGLFEKAAQAGHSQAERIFIAFLANGTGGPRLWREALRLLGESAPRDKDAARQLELIAAMALDEDGEPTHISDPQQRSAEPRILSFPAFFTPDECRYLAETAKPMLSPSEVVDPRTGALVANPIRTSDAAAFSLALESPAIHALNRRIARSSGTTTAQGEPLQVLRYRAGQEYKLHSDALPGADNQRICTFLVYLNEAFEGGETDFPQANVTVTARTGDGLLFFNALSDGRPDPAAWHAGCPVRSGEKLLASRWIRSQPIKLQPQNHQSVASQA